MALEVCPLVKLNAMVDDAAPPVLSADYTVANGPAATGYAFSFSTSQSGGNSSFVTTPYSTYSYNVTGNGFTIIGTEDWTGGTSNDFTNAANFTLLTGGGGFAPTTTTVVRIGGVNYTNAPAIAANTSIAGITFGSAKVSTLTINSGKTLTLSNGLSVLAGSTATVAGPGALTLSGGSISLTAGSSTLNLNGGATINNAGTFTTGASSIINLSGSSTLANTSTFTLASTAVLNLNASTLNNTSTFTFNSDASGTATLGSVLGASTITGTYAVQRYLQGSSADLSKRGYRLLSSPVYVSGATPSPYTSAKVYDLNFLVSGSIVTGLNGSGNGFTAGTSTSAVASLYLFRQDIVPNQSSFASGNFKSIAKLNNTPAYNFGINKKNTLTNAGDTTTYLPVGNGYLFFFRGNSTLNAGTTAGTKTTSPYNYPENTTLVQTGTLNTGNITVQPWFATSNNTNLSYTTTIANAVVGSNIRGYNLVGNPYPSTINWEKFNRQGTLAQSSIYGANFPAAGTTATKIYIFNSTSKQYAVYTPHTTISSAADTTTTEFLGANSSDGVVSNMISSGEGFFIVATAANQSLTFRESAKTTTQAATGNLAKIFAASVPVQSTVIPNPAMRIKLIMDSVNTDAIVITFNPKYSPNFFDDEDAIDFGGNGALVNLSAVSADAVDLSVDGLPFPSKTTPQVAPLAVSATSSGTYSLKMDLLENMPALFTIFLKDNFLKDSLDMRANTTYNFNIDNNNPATFGSGRFQMVIGENPALGMHLLSFNAAKVATATQVNVTWTVENEANYTEFYVQRSIDNGKTFQTIDSLQSSGIGAYSFIDNNPAKGANQYRLQLKDINNAITYSNVIIILFTDNSSNVLISNISIYPNPAKDVINVTIIGTNGAAGTYIATIINSDGSVIRSSSSSQATWQSSVSDLLPGTYILRVMNTTNQQLVGVNKFIKL